MSWKDEYRAALITFVLREGRPMQVEDVYHGELHPNYYGWTDWDAMRHFHPFMPSDASQPCPPIAPEGVEPKEHHFGQFQGTFYTGDDTTSAIVLHPVRCSCGKYEDIYWAYEGSMGEVIEGVLRED